MRRQGTYRLCGAVALLCIGIVIHWLVQYVQTRRSGR